MTNDEGVVPATSSCAAPTAHAARYIEQLCKHWSHKLQIERTADGAARIVMPSGATVTLRASDAHLGASILAADIAQLDETKQVVVDHVDRFAFREGPLFWAWTD